MRVMVAGDGWGLVPFPAALRNRRDATGARRDVTGARLWKNRREAVDPARGCEANQRAAKASEGAIPTSARRNKRGRTQMASSDHLSSDHTTL